MKKYLSLILSAAMCLSAVPMSAAAEEETDSDAITNDYVDYERIQTISEGISNGTYDADFNFDGVFSRADIAAIATFYAEVQTGMIESDGTVIRESVLSDEARALIAANGDITGNGAVDAEDCTYFLQYYYTRFVDGDANLDGIVDPSDASYILAYYSYSQTGTSNSNYEVVDDYFNTDRITYEEIERKGDYTGDGVVDAADASKILADYAESQASMVE
ncbi:MAG: hypothetical protein LUG91_07160 [Ruminococcus sp.]|nr:hypothetical protein [Ruminococcus sp.]